VLKSPAKLLKYVHTESKSPLPLKPLTAHQNDRS
jgi:hypothetical protein